MARTQDSTPETAWKRNSGFNDAMAAYYIFESLAFKINKKMGFLFTSICNSF